MTFRYCLGSDNRILWVSEEWLAFARENSAPELSPLRVVGRSLFAFISGAETEYFYYQLLDEIRTQQVKLAVPFRCDGPSVRRHMRLKMWPMEKQGVAFETTLVTETPRETIRFLDASAPRSEEALTICSWCKKVQAGNEWIEAEAAVGRLAPLRGARLPQQNHAVCESCGKRFRDLVRPSVPGRASGTGEA